MYDITSKESFKSLDHWLNDVRNWAGDADILLLGNKSDKGGRKVSYEEGVSYAKDHNISLFFETSALNGTNISEAFSSLLTGLFVCFFLSFLLIFVN